MPTPDPKGQAAQRYAEALAHCPASGAGVHAWMLGTANHAAYAGIDPAQAVSAITAAMTRRPSPPVEVRATVERAYRERGQAVGNLSIPTPPKPKPATRTAADYIQRGGGQGEADLWEASPVRIDWEPGPQDAVALLRALFLPGELVFCGDAYGREVRTREEWCSRWEDGEPPPPFLCVNPLKAAGGRTAGGHLSPRCDDAVAVFRHAVAEFDGMPLADQFPFWMGFGLDAVRAITYSAGKSLHAVLRVDAADREEWEAAVRGRLFRRLLIPLGCDRTCVNPSRLSRLAGARRPDKGGTIQRLLFVREELRA